MIKLHFAGRVRDNPADIAAYAPYVSNLWAIEIDPTSHTPSMVQLVQKQGFKSLCGFHDLRQRLRAIRNSVQKSFCHGRGITLRPIALFNVFKKWDLSLRIKIPSLAPKYPGIPTVLLAKNCRVV